MNYGSISRKSLTQSSRASRLPLILCLLFFLVYFSFLLFFRYTNNVSFTQYIILLLVISIIISAGFSFSSKVARITLALQVAFAAVCVINYYSFQKEMKEQFAEAQSQFQNRKQEYASYRQENNHDKSHTLPTEENKVVLTKWNINPLLLTRQNWRSYGMALAEILPFDDISNHERVASYFNMPQSDDRKNSAGWLGYTKLGTGCYFGLFYYATPLNTTFINKGDILKKSDLTHVPLVTSPNDSPFTPHLIVKDIKEKSAEGRTLYFLLELNQAEGLSCIRKSMGSITWKFIPAKPKTSAKRKLEFR